MPMFFSNGEPLGNNKDDAPPSFTVGHLEVPINDFIH